VAAVVALGILLALAGVAGLVAGAYALLRGGQGQKGGIGLISERGIHVVAGIRMAVVGTLSFAAGMYLLWTAL
jgi:hypothetical protein